MTRGVPKLLLVIFGVMHCIAGCTHDPLTTLEQDGIAGYPTKIGTIVTTRCAVEGCHDRESNDAAAGLDLSTWAAAMRGGRNNAAIVPYAPLQSTFFFSVNHFEDLGPGLTPAMPYGRPPLSRDEVLCIRDWIAAGAPSHTGEVAFEDVPADERLYVLNSRCREVSIIDLRSGLVMRYVSLDTAKSLGFAGSVLVHPQLPYWYVLFTNGIVQQFDVYSNRLCRSTHLPPGTWRTLSIPGNDAPLYAVNWAGTTDLQGGQIAALDPLSLGTDTVFSFAGDSLYFPVGWCAGENPDTYYTACYLGNFIYKITLGQNPGLVKIPLSPDAVSFNVSQYRPFSLIGSPEHQAYFVACERSAEVRRFNAATDSLEAVIPVGFFPQQMVIDAKRQHLIVSCTEDVNTFGTGKSSVYVIDLQSNAVVQRLYAGYQSRGLALDTTGELLYVANRNADPSGADEPHHYTECEGKNGYLSRIHLGSLLPDEAYRAELSGDPYDMSCR